MNIDTLNARLVAIGSEVSIKLHNNGLYYLAAANPDGSETILCSAMGHEWVQDWVAEYFRDLWLARYPEEAERQERLRKEKDARAMAAMEAEWLKVKAFIAAAA